MATYTIISRPDGKFDVAVVGRSGTRQTLLGFHSEQEAEKWIEHDRQLDAAGADPWVPTGIEQEWL